jgi:hypothetical protein
MILDAKLRWKENINETSVELNIKFRKMYLLLGRNSELSVHNKLILYTSKLYYVQFAFMVSSFGAEPVILILK